MITEELRLAATICDRITEVLGRPDGSIALDAKLADLAIDSIDLVEVAIDLQEEFDVWFDESDLVTIESVRDLVALIERRREEIATL